MIENFSIPSSTMLLPPDLVVNTTQQDEQPQQEQNVCKLDSNSKEKRDREVEIDR